MNLLTYIPTYLPKRMHTYTHTCIHTHTRTHTHRHDTHTMVYTTYNNLPKNLWVSSFLYICKAHLGERHVNMHRQREGEHVSHTGNPNISHTHIPLRAASACSVTALYVRVNWCTFGPSRRISLKTEAISSAVMRLFAIVNGTALG